MNHSWLVFLAGSILMMLIAVAVLHAARRRPAAVSAAIGCVVVVALAALGYAAFGAAEREAFGWFAAGFALLVLSCPAWVLVAVAGEPPGAALSWAGVADCARLLGGFLADPFWARRPTDEARAIIRLAKELLAYWVACWSLALILGILLGILAHVTDPGGSFR